MSSVVSRRSLMGRIGQALLASLVLLGANVPGAAVAQDPAATAPKTRKTVRLLTIGNSFSGDATRLLDELVAAAGHTLVYRTGSIGGGTVAQHWEKVRLHDLDPKDTRGLYATGRSLRQELLAEPWDFVTIQQASILSHNPTTYHPFAAQLHGFVRALAPQAEVLVHQTWAYRLDDPRFLVASPKPGEPATQRDMYEGLSRAYESLAKELGGPGGPLRILPVGNAFFRADTDLTWGFKPDLTFVRANAVHPALPDQSRSLHIGWRWRNPTPPAGATGAAPVLEMDGHHASVAGQYLAACVFYEVLYGESVEGNTFVPEGMDPAYGRFLQKTAHNAVAERVKVNSQ